MNYIVVGANFGDEGKGRACRYIADMHRKDVAIEKIVSIRHNGGSQAGHTSHGFVHHALGSANTITYLADSFVFDPFAFNKEFKEKTIFDSKIPYQVYIHKDCRIVTPIDILMNHVIETIRTKRHGSCGMGIHACIVRNETLPLTVKMLKEMSSSSKQVFAKLLISHYHGFEQAIRDIPEQFKNLNLDLIIARFFNEFDNALKDLAIVEDEKDFLEKFDLRIFEGAQGLLLDKDNKEYYPHVTPSKTDSTNPINILKRNDLNDSVQPIYCTRTYLTRHGEGNFPTKLFNTEAMNTIAKLDTTNVKNDWQGSLRCGYLDFNWKDRTLKDFEKYKGMNALKAKYFLTWWDVSNNCLFYENSVGTLMPTETLNLKEIESKTIEGKLLEHPFNLLTKHVKY